MPCQAIVGIVLENFSLATPIAQLNGAAARKISPANVWQKCSLFFRAGACQKCFFCRIKLFERALNWNGWVLNGKWAIYWFCEGVNERCGGISDGVNEWKLLHTNNFRYLINTYDYPFIRCLYVCVVWLNAVFEYIVGFIACYRRIWYGIGTLYEIRQNKRIFSPERWARRSYRYYVSRAM